MAFLNSGLPTSSQAQLPSSNSYPGSQNYHPRMSSLPEHAYNTSQMLSSAACYYSPAGTDHKKTPIALGQPYYIDSMIKPHSCSSLYPGIDMNAAARRKNASRETSGPLKAWLNEHKKNPYPTKGEKIIMAIASRMTLTQVSTWFANARRRMKKDKLTDENDDCKSELCAAEDSAAKQKTNRERSGSGSLSSGVSHTNSEHETSTDTSRELADESLDIDDATIKDQQTPKRPTKTCVQTLFTPDMRVDNVGNMSSSPEDIPESLVDIITGFNVPIPAANIDTTLPRPKIWSISEIIGSATGVLNASINHAAYELRSEPQSQCALNASCTEMLTHSLTSCSNGCTANVLNESPPNVQLETAVQNLN